MHTILRRLAPIAVTFLIAAGTARAGDVYVQTNLVSNVQGMAKLTDPNLRDPWGIAFSTTSPFWIADQASNVSGSSVATVYSVTGNNVAGPLLTVGVPNQGGATPSTSNGPTGEVNTSAPGITTSASDFQVGSSKAAFIFANIDGSISGWNGGAHATIEATVAGASFTGLAIGNTSTGAAQLYAADPISGNIDVFNSKWQMTGSFTAPKGLPAGFTAFNVQNLGGILYVTFANQAGSGGIVDEFTTNGTFIKTLINDTAGTHLDAPWGMAIAPKGWGQFGGDLLVGNNDGPGEINAYSLNGTWQGTLTLDTGRPFAESDLWALTFGNGGGGGDPNTLYFTAGLASNVDGLFGSIEAASVPEPNSVVLSSIAIGLLTALWRWKQWRWARNPA
jgi:uncharacterized protein (TIGR03118 family)